MKLAAWQKRWISRTFAPGVRVSALSLSRGNGKTALAGWLAAESMRPGSPWFSARTDVIILASSIQQCRELFGYTRDCIEDRGALGEYTENNNSLRLELTHKRTKARLRAISSSGKGAMGLSRFHLIILDEPASLAPRGGEHLYNALRQSLGKREGQRLILIGTRSGDNPGPWWSSLLDHGDGNGVIVTDIAAPDDAPWADFQTVKAANPLYARSAPLRAELKAERDEAIRNPTLRPAFEAYRLNRLVDVRSLTLLKTHEWKEVRRRPVPPREDRCIVGIDLGGSVSWSGGVGAVAERPCRSVGLGAGYP